MKLIISGELLLNNIEFQYLAESVYNNHIAAKNGLRESKKQKKNSRIIRGYGVTENSLRDTLKYRADRKLALMSNLINFLYEFLKIHCVKIFESEITECVIVWPKNFSQIIESTIKIDSRNFEAVLTDILCLIHFEKEQYIKIMRGSGLFLFQYYLNQMVSISVSVPFFTNKFESLVDFFHRFVVPRVNNVTISDEHSEKIMNLKYNFLTSDDKKSLNKLKKDALLYFLEDTNDIIKDIIKNNHNTIALSKYSNKRYNHEIDIIKQKLGTIINDVVNTNTDKSYEQIYFPEALDRQLLVLINHFINSSEDDYLYLECSEQFILKNILNHLNQYEKIQVSEIEIDESEHFLLPNTEYLLINGFNRVSNAKIQHQLWDTIFRHNNKIRKLILFDSTEPRSAFIKINNSKKWIYQEELAVKNISKIFHSMLPPDLQIGIDSDIFEAIKNNKFNDLIVIANENINYNLINDALAITNKSLIFDYRSAISWYEYREAYKRLSNSNRAKQNKALLDDTGIYVEFVLSGKQVNISCGDKKETIDYNKNFVMFYLIVKNAELHNPKISLRQLTTITNRYIFSKSILKRRIVDNNISINSDYKNVKKHFSKFETVNSKPSMLREITKDTIQFEHITQKTSTLSRISEKDYLVVFKNFDSLGNKKYTLHFRNIELYDDLFDAKYEDTLKTYYKLS